MPQWRAVLGRTRRILPVAALLGVVVFLLGPYVLQFKNFIAATNPQQPSPSSGYKLVRIDTDGHELFEPINDLPTNAPLGYFYIRVKKLDNTSLSPLLQKSQCVSDCDSDNALWLVPKPNQ